MGPFFSRLAQWLESHGQEVHKVNFNGGDRWFYRRSRTHAYRGRHEDLTDWLEALIIAHRIDAVVLFGQHRPVHELARAVAARLGLPIFVFEEGYLRPDYITLEEGGVNGWSSVPRRAESYRFLPVDPPAVHPEPTGQRFMLMAWYATLYSLAMWLQWPWFRHHVYHRPLHPVTQALAWLRGGMRKWWHGWAQRSLLEQLTSAQRSRRYFLLPLQVHNDSQMLMHSPYPSVEGVIDDVMTSFARHADRGDWLVIKHHPMDRAYRNYARHIARRAVELGLQGRVLYVHDLHLPTLLRHAKGVVTVNSTTGLQALYHKVPVITLGECFYALDGLVHQGPLARFWQDPGQVNGPLFNQLRHYLLRHNQINGSFYGRVPGFEQVTQRPRERDDGSAIAVSQPLPLDIPDHTHLPPSHGLGTPVGAQTGSSGTSAFTA